jgi:solute carrier family 35 (UDP-xylose/UDP-N-acetylglucosamine transporter), member B4
MVGLAVSMLFGYFTMEKKYNTTQIVCLTSRVSEGLYSLNECMKLAVCFVTSGVILATVSGPSSSTSQVRIADDVWPYFMGISMLVLASLLTGYYGTLQEKTYTRYGPHWREGVFYTVSHANLSTLLVIDARTAAPILIAHVHLPKVRHTERSNHLVENV